MRYHRTPIRMAVIKKVINNKYWQGYGEKETLVHCRRECKLVPPLWKTVCRFLKKLKIELDTIQQFHFWVFTQRKQKH